MIIRTRLAPDTDRLICTDCHATRAIPRGQGLVQSRRQSGHTCGDPVWTIPDYTPAQPRARRRTPAVP